MSKQLPTILFVGDTPNKREVATGFGTVTAELVPELAHHFNVAIHAVNSLGWEHEFPAQIFPASTWRNPNDPYGFSTIAHHLSQVQPSAVVYNNDPWIVASWLKEIGKPLSEHGIPQIAYLAIDSERQPSRFVEPLRQLDRIFVYTEFAQAELARHGLASEVLPHGADTEFWTPGDRVAARNAIGLNPTSFVVLNPNKNQWRKRNDLTVAGFVEWMRRHHEQHGELPDALLHLHCLEWTHEGWNLQELYDDEIRLAGLSDPRREHLVKTKVMPVPDVGLRDIYRSANVVINTTSAEGWGLCHSESAACGIPQIVPKHSSFVEVFDNSDAVFWLTDFERERSREGFLRWTPRVSDIAGQLKLAYQAHQTRLDQKIGRELRAVICRPELQWRAIAAHLAAAIKVTVPKSRLEPPVLEAA